MSSSDQPSSSLSQVLFRRQGGLGVRFRLGTSRTRCCICDDVFAPLSSRVLASVLWSIARLRLLDRFGTSCGLASGKSGGRGGGSLLLPSACGMAGDSGGGGRKSWNVCLATFVGGGFAWPPLQFIFIKAVGNGTCPQGKVIGTGGVPGINSVRDGMAFAMIFSFMGSPIFLDSDGPFTAFFAVRVPRSPPLFNRGLTTMRLLVIVGTVVLSLFSSMNWVAALAEELGLTFDGDCLESSSLRLAAASYGSAALGSLSLPGLRLRDGDGECQEML